MPDLLASGANSREQGDEMLRGFEDLRRQKAGQYGEAAAAAMAGEVVLNMQPAHNSQIPVNFAHYVVCFRIALNEDNNISTKRNNQKAFNIPTKANQPCSDREVVGAVESMKAIMI